jgi:hypothetical protein
MPEPEEVASRDNVAIFDVRGNSPEGAQLISCYR